MIPSYKLYSKILSLAKDDCLTLDHAPDDPLLLAFETGKAAGIASLAKEICLDWFGEAYDEVIERWKHE